MTVEEIRALINRAIVENYTGDITAEDVNKIFNETLDHVGESETKVTQLASKVGDISDSNAERLEIKINAILSCLSDLVTKIVFHTSEGYQLPAELKKHLSLEKFNEEPPTPPTPSDSAICGTAICGIAVCGKN